MAKTALAAVAALAALAGCGDEEADTARGETMPPIIAPTTTRPEMPVLKMPDLQLSDCAKARASEIQPYGTWLTGDGPSEAGDVMDPESFHIVNDTCFGWGWPQGRPTKGKRLINCGRLFFANCRWYTP